LLCFDLDQESQSWTNNGGTGNILVNASAQHIINISKSGKDDRRLFDVFVSLSDTVADRMLVEITQKQSF